MSKLALNNVSNEFGIEESKAQQIKVIFEPMVSMLETFEKKYNEVIVDSEKEITESTTEKARELRLSIRKVRIDADKAHKELKAETLRYGRAVDGVKNILKYAVTEKEENLSKIEKHFELLENEKIAKLQVEREKKISEYMETEGLELGKMSESGFDIFLSGAKARHEAEIKAEKEAEEQRLKKEEEERLERKRIEEENKKLKAEAEEKEQERKKIEKAERLKREELEAKIEKERKDAKDKADKIAKANAEKEEKIRKEKEELERKASEEKAKIDAENARIEQEKKDRLNSSAKEKLIYLQEQISKIELPIVNNEHAQETIEQTRILLGKVFSYIETRKGKM